MLAVRWDTKLLSVGLNSKDATFICTNQDQ